LRRGWFYQAYEGVGHSHLLMTAPKLKKIISQCDHVVCTCDYTCAKCPAGNDCPPDCGSGSSSSVISHSCADGVVIHCYSVCTPSPIAPTALTPCASCGFRDPATGLLYSTLDIAAGSYDSPAWAVNEANYWAWVHITWPAITYTATPPEGGGCTYDPNPTDGIVGAVAEYWAIPNTIAAIEFPTNYNGTATGYEEIFGGGEGDAISVPAFSANPYSYVNVNSVTGEVYAGGYNGWSSLNQSFPGYNSYRDIIPCCTSGMIEVYGGGVAQGCCPGTMTAAHNTDGSAAGCCPTAFTYSTSLHQCVWAG